MTQHSPSMPSDPASKKKFLSKLLTIYGRKAVLEALESSLEIYRLHLSTSNKSAPIIKQIKQLAQRRHVEIVYHNKQELSRISKNSKQDQGIAADVLCPEHTLYSDWITTHSTQAITLLALDGIHNPQNVGMIIRSATAAGIDGLLMSKKGNAALGPLVIKASSGSVFKAPIIHCDNLSDTLRSLQRTHCDIVTLDSHASQCITRFTPPQRCCYVLGNETHGVSSTINTFSQQQLSIPMSNGIESLNVAVTAGLIAYQHHFKS
jgi:23S rRNA (guanosine2251-2'-O)-methyltransferase